MPDSFLPQTSRPRHRGAVAIVALLAVALLLCGATRGDAARVSGTLVGYESETPQTARDLHFQDAITHDIFLSPTHTDGSFGTDLPPGLYDLRAERGVMLMRGIAVGDADVELGRVNEAAPYTPARLFQLQNLAPTLLTSPAPATAYVMTRDPTELPGVATIPKPASNFGVPPVTMGTPIAMSTAGAKSAAVDSPASAGASASMPPEPGIPNYTEPPLMSPNYTEPPLMSPNSNQPPPAGVPNP
jgi:hypothetical protein